MTNKALLRRGLYLEYATLGWNVVGVVVVVAAAVLDWWWADPLAGLVIVYYGLTEGWAAWRGEES